MTPTASVARFRPAWLFAGLAVLVVGIEHQIIKTPAFRQQPLLPVGATADLLLVVPALFYWLVARPYRLPLSSVAGVVGAGLAVAFWLIPAAQQAPLRALRWLPALLEAVTLLVLAAKARRLVQAYRAAHAQTPQFWPSAQAAVRTLGRAGDFLWAEMSLLRYAVLGWGATPEIRAGAQAFSNYRESGFSALVVALGVALTVETAGLHLLVSHWSPFLAGWVLFFDVYLVVTCVAHGHAVRLRPALLTADFLEVRVGCMWQLAVPRAALVAVEPLRAAPAPDPETLHLSKLLFTTPNLLLTFAEPVTLAGPYGTRRTARRVAVYLDEPHGFVAAMGLPPHSSTR